MAEEGKLQAKAQADKSYFCQASLNSPKMVVCFPSTRDQSEDVSYSNTKAFCTEIKDRLKLGKWKGQGKSLAEGDVTEVNSRVSPSFKHD